MKQRKPDTHKGDYGHVLVVGGSVGFVGAPILAAAAALRAGAGLVSLAVPREVYPVVARKAPAEIMVHPFSGAVGRVPFGGGSVLLRKADVVAVGPGLSRRPAAVSLARRLIAGCRQPMVVDADALAAFEGGRRIRRGSGAGTVVITPHPGEMARLLGTTVRKVQSDRRGIAARTAKRLGAVVVLKGHRTVIASPSGRTAVNRTGNPGMATAGTGDVLTGVIAALIGQGMDPFAAAKAGAYVHGLAGDLAARRVGQVSLTAGDVLSYLPAAFKRSLR